MRKGEIIVIEGCDFSGKKTQAKLLVDRLKNEKISCETISFPRYDKPTGRIVGGPYLGKTEICPSYFDNPALVEAKIASLYFAADRRGAIQEINHIINSGSHLILDRYVESNMAHQGAKAKTKEERTSVINFIRKLEYELLELPIPSETIFLSMPLEVILQLRNRRDKGNRDGHESNDEYLKKSIETYNFLANMFPWTRVECAPDKTINSLRTPENIAEEVYEKVIESIG